MKAVKGRDCSIIFWAVVISHHCVQVWVPQYKKDIKLLNSIKRRTAKMIKSAQGQIYKEKLKSLGLIS